MFKGKDGKLIATALAIALAVALAAGLVAPGRAGADVVPAMSIDGPSPDIAGVGGIALARDATGGVVYLKNVGGAAHVFVATIANGVWSQPLQVDGGLPGPSSQPVIAAAEKGRVAICFINGGTLYGTVRAAGTPGFSPLQAISPALADPSLSMGISGTAYVSFTVADGSGADVRAARLDLAGTSFSLLPSPLNADPASRAGVGAAKRSRVITSADGTGLVTWGEDGADGRTHVHLRRVFGLQVSSVDNDATLGSLAGSPGGSADSPDVGIQYDSSFGWLTFRQTFVGPTGAHSRVVLVALLGSQLQPPVAVDSLGAAPADNADAPRIAIDGTGDGLLASELDGSHNVIGSVEAGSGFTAGDVLNTTPVSVAPTPVVALGQDNVGLAAWQPDSGSVQARRFDNSTPDPPLVISRPDFGATDIADGFAAAADSVGDSTVAFEQGVPGARRVVVGAMIKPPGRASLVGNAESFHSSRVLLHWKPAKDVWSAPLYTVKIDGVAWRTTTAAQLVTAVPPGNHHWRVVATDSAGQSTSSTERRLQINPGKLAAKLRVSGTLRAGMPLSFRVSLRSTDPKHGGARARRTSIDFGDGTKPLSGASAVHAFAQPGTYVVLALVTDGAGRSVAAYKRILISP